MAEKQIKKIGQRDFGFKLVGHDPKPDEHDDRAIVISNPYEMLGTHFGGFIVDANGTIQIRNVQISAKELPAVLGHMIVGLTDGVYKMENISDPETYIKDIYTNPDKLGFRQEIIEKVVEVIRVRASEQLA